MQNKQTIFHWQDPEQLLAESRGKILEPTQSWAINFMDKKFRQQRCYKEAEGNFLKKSK